MALEVQFMRINRSLTAAVVVLVVSLIAGRTSAQEIAQGKARKIQAVEAAPATAQPTGSQPAEPQAVGQDGKPVVPPGESAGGPGQPPLKPGEAPKTDIVPKTTPRPAKPAIAPNRDELKVRPDDGGRVRFNFQGQPWLDVLEWLAQISHLSLDWQEIPADFLNLRTQRSYTVDEARDLINRHLLDRGFTMLKHGEVLTVVNIKKLDPSLVPRVAPDDLDEREPHEFAKVSFPLESLTAETATEELKPMLSPNGKLSALKATNRVEALDAVVNLREIRDVLAQEQSNRGRKRLVREFKLEYTRAAEVREQLEGLLGLEKKPAVPAGQQDPNQAAMQQQMAMMEVQRHGGGQPGGQPAPPKPAPTVHMVVNTRENSIVAQAPADQMAVIAEAVKLIDVPSSRAQSFLRNMNRTQVYRLAAIDPEPIVKMLQELGDLDPTTRLQIDKRNRSIIAYASLADHLTIRTLVTKLDGTDRRFEVIKLRRLEADYVAGTIEFMMGGGDKKKQQQNNRYYPYFMDFGFGGGRNNNDEDESRKFRVDADVEHNRLLLWANAVELEEVNHLLVKLGEIPAEGGNLSTLRIVDTIPPEEVEQLLERLRRTWPGVGPNPLEIVPPEEPEAAEPPPRQTPPKKKAARKKATPDDATTQVPDRRSEERIAKSERPPAGEKTTQSPAVRKPDGATYVATRLLHLIDDVGDDDSEEVDDPPPKAAPDHKKPVAGEEQVPEADVPPQPRAGNRPPRTSQSANSPPIRIGRGADGRMVISSPDTHALDRLEDLLIEIAPPRKDYKIFKMRYKSTWAYGVALNLKDFFEEKDKSDQRRNNLRFFGAQNNDDERRLSKRRPLKFIADSDSNSILVTGADPNQLKIVEELIAVYDVPESKDSAAVRKTKLVPLKYSKARVIADAVKEVYRDLLSANDPALQQNNNQNGNQKQKPPDAMYTYINNFGGDDQKPDTPMKFKGLLSLGVDELSNTLVISAAEGLLENVLATVEALDNAARPMVNNMRVLKIDRSIDVAELQKKLTKLVTRPPQPQQPQPGQPGQQRGAQQPNQNGLQLPPPDSVVEIDR